MRATALVASLLAIGALTRTATMAAPAPPQTAGSATITIDEVARRVMLAESGVTARMRAFRPIVEVYAQHVEADARLGTVPVRDEYFVGQFEWLDLVGTKLTRLTPEKGTGRRMADWLSRPFGVQLNFDAFAAMTVPDWRLLNGTQNSFTYLRRETLGDVRCVVFDVAPRHDSRDGFTGRIWVEDRDFNIVRFNGMTRSPGSGTPLWFSVDSWRTNVKPGLWLPSYIYSELQTGAGSAIKSQVRLWGYDLTAIPAPPPLTAAITSQQAEENVLVRLSRAGLLAPRGEVDKVLETVLSNLQVTNHLAIEPVTTRVLLTSPLESFTVGRTIVLSRGLIDVLPDEASLAAMLAHELAHVVLGHGAIDAKLPIADPLAVPDEALLSTVANRLLPKDEEAADLRAMEWMRHSPYKDKLSEAGLFLRAVSDQSKKLKHLIQPHLAGRTTVPHATTLSPERIDQVAALPLGGRVVVDAWSGRLELSTAANVPLASAREKASLAVAPLVPYLKYFEPRP